MPDESNARPLIHVHACIRCGGAFRREAFEGRMHATGIFPCPKCGIEGPLNLEIRELNDAESGRLANK